MPIHMQAQDGSIQMFPDGTSPDAVHLAMLAYDDPDTWGGLAGKVGRAIGQSASSTSGQGDEQMTSQSAQQQAALVCPPGTSLETHHMLTTGYDNSYQSTGKDPGDPGYGVTSHGDAAQSGTIAAPRSYPYGTQMFIPGYGSGSVQDRGGAIKGDHIDLWFPNTDAALQWGKRYKDVQVCKK